MHSLPKPYTGVVAAEALPSLSKSATDMVVAEVKTSLTRPSPAAGAAEGGATQVDYDCT